MSTFFYAPFCPDVPSCCTSSNQCGIFEGICNGDNNACLGHLLCGQNKCEGFPSRWLFTDECCYDPFSSKSK